MVTLPAFVLTFFWSKVRSLPDGVEMSTVDPPPAPPPPAAGVVEAGVEAAFVELSLPPPPQAARPLAASAATISTAKARLIRVTFLSSPAVGRTLLRGRGPAGLVSRPETRAAPRQRTR